MSNFPNSYDDDTTLPPVNDNIQEIGAEAINAVRDAIFNTEQYLGIGGAGTTESISSRIGISLDPDGNIRPSAIASLGLITLPITNDQISNTAEIPESKLKLDHRTQDLFNYIRDLSSSINLSLGWISLTGIKLEPHLIGAIYRHTLNQIDVSTDSDQFLNNKFNVLRDNHDAYTLIEDINNELLSHQFADGSLIDDIQPVITFSGLSYPSNYSHTASGIFLNTSRFTVIPQTAEDLQQLAEFIDSSSIFTFGGRIQNLYTNGISRSSRSISLSEDGYGSNIIPITPVITYLLNTDSSSSPFDDINTGDDIVEFVPPTDQVISNSFDGNFALVKIGDIIRINYGSVETQYIIKEKKYIQNSGNKKYVVRINGKNLFYSTIASARIDRPLFNNNKYGVLAVAAANNAFSETSSLIVGQPRGAQCLGIGFNPNQLNSSHYLLYLILYPTGNPIEGYSILPGIDITGNQGITPGQYTLSSVVEATNNAFRNPGYNYRFIAFSHNGEFGIMLADSYNNAGFSVVSALVDSVGFYDSALTNFTFPNNVIDVFMAVNGSAPIDALGLGPFHADMASPPFSSSYPSAESSQIPTKIFLPLKRNNYYVNGIEKERLSLEFEQIPDVHGDGYWVGTITNKQIIPGPSGRVEVTYSIPLDLSQTNLKLGKTLVVQPLNNVVQSGIVNYGRFIIKGINIVGCEPNVSTELTVYDAIHATALSPSVALNIGTQVAIYFGADSISFNKESATDFDILSVFKRHFEIYTDQLGNTFTHERGRINISGINKSVNGITLYTSSELGKLNIVKISPKLRGYQFGSVNKITLNIIEYDNVTESFSGKLSFYNGTIHQRLGPITSGRKGEIVRFYDETNIDFIDIVFDFEEVISSFSDANIDFQLFPTLSLDEEIMLISTCQFNDISKVTNYVRDERQFGNTSEKDLSSSALDFISLPEKLLHSNGVIRGFDLLDGYNLVNNQIYLSGGEVLVNGKFIQKNSDTVSMPIVKELFDSTLFDIEWAVCINDRGEYQTIPLLDYDSAINNPTDTFRKFTAYNPENGNSYLVDAVTFSDLIGKRKDLTILYIVLTGVDHMVDPATVFVIAVDARKYLIDAETNDPLILTSDGVQGNFKSFRALSTWLNRNTSFNTHVLMRGEIDLQSLQTLNFSDSIQRQITFEGDGCTVNVHSSIGFFINSYVKFKNINFVYKHTPSPALTSTDQVNNGQGLIYISPNINLTSTDIVIEDCTFSVDNENGQKYSYINLEIASSDTVVDNIIIRNNRFKVQNNDDFSAAIAIVNRSTDSNDLQGCVLKNTLIDHNILDSEQSIILTTAKNINTNLFDSPGIICLNSKISNNYCGAIGVLTTATTAGDGYSEFNTGLSIDHNTCRYIANLDEKGKFIEVYNISLDDLNVTNNTGVVSITNNNCSFIHHGFVKLTATGNRNCLRISDNNLHARIVFEVPHGTDYLSNFDYPIGNKRYAIYVSSPFVNDNRTSMNTIISGNSTFAGQTLIDPGTGNDNTGYESYIRCGASASITNNTLHGIIQPPVPTSEYSGIIFDGYCGIISDNCVASGGLSIYAYLTTRFNLSSVSTFVQATGNFFDTASADNITEVVGKDFAGNLLSKYWLFERNINQTEIASIRSSIGQHGYSGSHYPIGSRFSIIGGLLSDWEVTVTDNTSLLDNNIQLHYAAAAAAHRYHLWLVKFRDILPHNVQIIRIETSVKSTAQLSEVNCGTEFKLYHQDSILQTVNVDLDAPYVANTLVPVSIIPNVYVRNSVTQEVTFAVISDIGHSSTAIVCIKNIDVTYRW